MPSDARFDAPDPARDAAPVRDAATLPAAPVTSEPSQVPSWAQQLARPTTPTVAFGRAGAPVPATDLADLVVARLGEMPGPAGPATGAPPPVSGTVSASVPVLAEHTRYVDGFALHLGLRDAVAVALRPGTAPVPSPDAPGVAVDGDTDLAAAVRAAADALGRPVRAAAVATSLPPALADVRALAAAAATVRALAPGLAEAAAQRAVVAAVSHVLGVPVSRSDAAAALVARAGHLVLSDAASGETLALGLPSDLAWGLVPTGEARSPVRVAALARRAERARAHVAERHRPVASLREIEHEELAGLLATVEPRHRSALAYLVGEDRRVQRFVGALRRRDAQMMGAILALSAHARDDWARLTDAERAALAGLDARTGDGVFGATDVGYARALLVLARPTALGPALAAAAAALGLPTDAAFVA